MGDRKEEIRRRLEEESLTDKLMWTVMECRVEIWGWEEREEIEKLDKRYLNWLLGVERRTPEHLVREKLQRE